MISHSKTSLDRELTRISGELARRRRDRMKRTFHMHVWYFTVGTSYRLKRFFDIVLSLAALAALGELGSWSDLPLLQELDGGRPPLSGAARTAAAKLMKRQKNNI